MRAVARRLRTPARAPCPAAHHSTVRGENPPGEGDLTATGCRGGTVICMPFAVLETFVAAKTGRVEDSEDVVADGAHFTVLADGATDKFGVRYGRRTGGQLTAQLICDVVANAPQGIAVPDLLAAINSAYARTFTALLTGQPVTERPSASFVAVEKATGRIVRVGDTSWRTVTQVHAGVRHVDEVNASTRSTLLRHLLRAGHTVADLRGEDPGRALILPRLRQQALLRNPAEVGPLTFGEIDGRPVPPRFVEEWRLPDTDTDVVLASDGYPLLFMTLAACEGYLAADLELDPLRIGKHAGTKAHRPDQVSFDDRAFVHLGRAVSAAEPGRTVGTDARPKGNIS